MIRRGSKVKWRQSSNVMQGTYQRSRFDFSRFRYVYIVLCDDGRERTIDPSSIIRERGET